jgi:hypothetical protein
MHNVSEIVRPLVGQALDIIADQIESAYAQDY